MFRKIKVCCLGLFFLMSLAACGLSPQANITQKGEAAQQSKNELSKKDLLAKAEEQKRAETQTKSDPPIKPSTGIQSIFNEYWIQFLGVIISVIGVILAISGFSLSDNKKKKFLKKLFHEIDDTYGSFKQTNRKCEAELLRLQAVVEEHLKDGSIDENTYQLLERRIDKYLAEMKESQK